MRHTIFWILVLLVSAGCTLGDPVSVGAVGGDSKVTEKEPTSNLVFESPVPEPKAAFSALAFTMTDDGGDGGSPSVPTLTQTSPLTVSVPSGVCSSGEGKRIIVDLSEQTLYACEGEQLVLETLISTGTAAHPTPVGRYHIWIKMVADRMTGPGYDLPAVPWTMYFYGGYAVHGAYWHNEFGSVRSHGCVNLPTMECPPGWTCPAQKFADGRDVARELFEWADPVLPEGAWYVYSSEDNPGTLVIVRE